MYIINNFFFLFLFSFFYIANTATMLFQDSNNFGPYNVSWSRNEVCRGPKAKNLTNVENNLIIDKDKYKGYFNITFFDATRIDEIKIVVHSLKGAVKSLLWTYKLSDPCNHFAFSTIIEKYLKAKDCNVDKGTYYAEVNFKEVTRSFLGSSFFYGDFQFKANVNSKTGNIMCIIVEMSFAKKII